MRGASEIARYLLGLIFLVFGFGGLFHFLHMPVPTGVAAEFFSAIFASHFHVVIFLLQIVPAVLLLANRYVPLALTILGPIVFNIVCIHIFMIRAGLPLAIVVTILWLLVAYSVRSAFSGIFQRLALITKDGGAVFAQYDVIRALGVRMRGAKTRITGKAKATKMLEDDPGSTSAQMRDPR